VQLLDDRDAGGHAIFVSSRRGPGSRIGSFGFPPAAFVAPRKLLIAILVNDDGSDQRKAGGMTVIDLENIGSICKLFKT